MTELVFLRRRLCSVETGGVRVLDALRWSTPFGSALRIYLGRGAGADDIAGLGDLRLNRAEDVLDNLVVTGEAPGGDGPVTVSLKGAAVDLPTAAPETDLLEDRNVVLGQRLGESAAHVAQWLRYHVDHHGADALVLFDRGKPRGKSDKFARNLSKQAHKIKGLRCVLLVDCALPLGAPGQPAIGDPGRAPRAKQRDAKPDPWHADLHESALYDLLKARFLTRAGAVITLDPCDMLRASPDPVGAFDLCRQSHTGVMVLGGEAVFPWRVRKGDPPVLGDHICRAVPAIAAPVGWAVAPKRLGATLPWGRDRIVGAQILTDDVVYYDRAMAMVFARNEIAELVNKDLLEPDAALMARAEDAFDHVPVAAPDRLTAQKVAATPPPSGRKVIVTCMKNEGPFLLEWIAYHRSIGIDDFLVYTNDCDDGSDDFLDLLDRRGIVQRRDNPFRETGHKPQQSALNAAWSEPVVQNAGWIMSLDVDEFINIHVGQGHLDDLIAAAGNPSLISMTWRLFGNDDVIAYTDQPVTAQFTRCAPHLIRRPHQAWGFKTMLRNEGLFEGLGVHRPKGFRGGHRPLWVNGSGVQMPQRFLKTGWRSDMGTYGYDLVTLNHYSLRSAQSFLVKRDRGRVNHVARDQGVGYWFRMNNNAEEDLSIQSRLPALEAELTGLMADPEIAAQHHACVAAHRAKIDQLLQDPGYGALYKDLTSTRLQKLSRMHRHFGMNVFLRGPGSVPDKVLEPGLPPNFFFNTTPPDGKAVE